MCVKLKLDFKDEFIICNLDLLSEDWIVDQIYLLHNGKCISKSSVRTDVVKFKVDCQGIYLVQVLCHDKAKVKCFFESESLEMINLVERRKQLEIFILGSCVSRDIFNAAQFREKYKLVKYLARSSIASLMSEPILNINPDEIKLDSTFQRDMVYADLTKSFWSDIKTIQHDILLIDFIDERFDLLMNQNSVITRSSEMVNAKLENWFSDFKLIPFGDAIETKLECLELFILKLQAINEITKVIVHEAYWSEKYVSKEGCECFFDEKTRSNVALHNGFLTKLYDKLRSNNIRLVKAETILADESNVWGINPFHYTKSYYENIGEEIDKDVLLMHDEGFTVECFPDVKNSKILAQEYLELSLQVSIDNNQLEVFIDEMDTSITIIAYYLLKNKEAVEKRYSKLRREKFTLTDDGLYSVLVFYFTEANERRSKYSYEIFFYGVAMNRSHPPGKSLLFNLRDYFAACYRCDTTVFSVDECKISYLSVPYPVYEIKKLDFNLSLPATTLVFLHSLEFLDYFFYQFINDDYSNFDLVKSVIFDYLRCSVKNSYEWYDHSMGKRSERLSLFYLLVSDRLSGKEINELYNRLIFERNQLFSERLYTVDGNHGLFQDIGLISICAVIHDESNLLFGLQRVINHYYNSYTPNGVHNENSTGYFYAVNELLWSLFNKIDDIDFLEKKLLEKAREFVFLEKIVVSRGDTEYSNKKIILKQQCHEFIEDGLVLFSNNSYSSCFIAGNLSHIHKHQDNLAFNYVYKGKEFFIDPGYAGYNYSDVSQFMFTQSSHHNTIYEEGYLPLIYDRNIINNVTMIRDIGKNSYTGQSFEYPDSFISRNVNYHDEYLEINDKIENKLNKLFIVNFHLHPNVKVAIYDSYIELNHDEEIIYLGIKNDIYNVQIAKDINFFDPTLKKIIPSQRLFIPVSGDYTNSIIITHDKQHLDRLRLIDLTRIQKKSKIIYNYIIQKNYFFLDGKLFFEFTASEKLNCKLFLYSNGKSMGSQICINKQKVFFSIKHSGVYYFVYRFYLSDGSQYAFGYEKPITIAVEVG